MIFHREILDMPTESDKVGKSETFGFDKEHYPKHSVQAYSDTHGLKQNNKFLSTIKSDLDLVDIDDLY